MKYMSFSWLIILGSLALAACATPTISLRVVGYAPDGRTTSTLSSLTVTGNHLWLEDGTASIATSRAVVTYNSSKEGFWTVAGVLGGAAIMRGAGTVATAITAPVAAAGYAVTKTMSKPTTSTLQSTPAVVRELKP